MRHFMRLLPILRRSGQCVNARTLFGRGYDPFTDMFRQLERSRREMDRLMDRMLGDSFIDRSTLPRLPGFWAQTKNIPVETTTDDSGLYRCSVDLEGYSPENIKVTAIGNTVSVTAKKEESSGNSKVLRETVYHYTLPENVNVESLRSRLESGGTLVLEAPYLKLEAPKSQEIPVEKQQEKIDNK